VGGVRGVAEQHGPAAGPALAADRAKAQPPGPVADQRVAPQLPGERLLQVAQRGEVGGVGRGLPGRGLEPGTAPGLLVGLDEERAVAAGVRVGVRDERAVLGLDRREHGVGQGEVGPAPQVQAAPGLGVPAEVPGLPGDAADPVRRDDDVRVQVPGPPARAVLQPHAGLLRMPLQHGEQFGARDADQPVVVHPDDPVPDLHRHVVPASRGQDVAQRFRVRELEVALGAGRKPDPEAERDIRFTLFVHDHLARRVRELEQARSVQPAWPPAEHRDSL